MQQSADYWHLESCYITAWVKHQNVPISILGISQYKQYIWSNINLQNKYRVRVKHNIYSNSIIASTNTSGRFEWKPHLRFWQPDWHQLLHHGRQGFNGMSIVSGKVTPSIGKTFSKTHIISTGITIYLIIVHVDVFCFQMENILITPVAYTVLCTCADILSL